MGILGMEEVLSEVRRVRLSLSYQSNALTGFWAIHLRQEIVFPWNVMRFE